MLIKKDKIRVGGSEIWIDETGILILAIGEEEEISLEEVTECFNTYRRLGIGPDNRVLQLINPGDNAQMSPEGRKYASVHGKDYFKASAVISNSLSIRLLVNFFNSFYKSEVPFKMFGTEDAARKWLDAFR
ncbi:MAG: hypothetical protein K0S32_3432 [Bacteroidetes bacterium]|jgi:hypothetical protein|nr:hypothetical protein [Bacteroidota bacterium]